MEITDISKSKEEQISEYNNLPEDKRKILECSYSVVSETKASESRINELKLFCKRMGYSKIGIAFCKGLRDFAVKLDEELSKDFEVYSACCSINGILKSDIHVKHINHDSIEPACNPLGQSEALNSKKVDIVLKCGFCLGHDLLFSQKIKAPCTTIIVKDRKLGHKTIDFFSDSE